MSRSLGAIRPRVALTFLLGLMVLVSAGGLVFGRATRIRSSYAFVRGDMVLVGAPMEGQLASVEVNPGQRVKKGDVLARLRDDALRPEVNRARASHERAGLAVAAERQAIEVAQKRIVSDRRRLSERLSATAAGQEIAVIAARHARAVAERSLALASRSYAPAADLDDDMAQADTARVVLAGRRAERRGARAELEALSVAEAELEARSDRIGLLRTEVVSAKAALEAAQGRLDMTVIRAQADGRVTRRILGPGASIRFSDPIVEMWLHGPVAIEAWIEESELGELTAGREVRVSFPGLDRAFTGTIDAIAMVSDAEVRSVSVTVPVGNRLAKSRWIRSHITLKDPDERLVPGLTAEVTIVNRTRR